MCSASEPLPRCCQKFLAHELEQESSWPSQPQWSTRLFSDSSHVRTTLTTVAIATMHVPCSHIEFLPRAHMPFLNLSSTHTCLRFSSYPSSLPSLTGKHVPELTCREPQNTLQSRPRPAPGGSESLGKGSRLRSFSSNSPGTLMCHEGCNPCPNTQKDYFISADGTPARKPRSRGCLAQAWVKTVHLVNPHRTSVHLGREGRQEGLLFSVGQPDRRGCMFPQGLWQAYRLLTPAPKLYPALSWVTALHGPPSPQ